MLEARWNYAHFTVTGSEALSGLVPCVEAVLNPAAEMAFSVNCPPAGVHTNSLTAWGLLPSPSFILEALSRMGSASPGEGLAPYHFGTACDFHLLYK